MKLTRQGSGNETIRWRAKPFAINLGRGADYCGGRGIFQGTASDAAIGADGAIAHHIGICAHLFLHHGDRPAGRRYTENRSTLPSTSGSTGIGF